MALTILLNSGLILAGLLLLYFGGNFLVKGAGGLALKFRIAPIIVGLTVVAFGTSAPELFVSLISALQGLKEISLGNVVGSNIINIALILGISALIIPIPVSNGIIRRDIPLMFASYAIFFVVVLPFSWEGLGGGGAGRIFRLEGAVMIVALIAYVVFLYRYSQQHEEEVEELIEMDSVDESESSRPVAILLLEIAGGIAALGFGSDFLIDGASWMARELFGASERFIGITIVAFGTSLPELVTSVVAASKKQMDISVGNIVGSNIFNSLMVLGATALVTPLYIFARVFTHELIIMIGVSMLLFFIVLLRKKLERWSGMVFLLAYSGYFAYLLQSRTV
jgi:cation:H+ antiporter